MTSTQEHTIHEQNIEALCAIFRLGCKPAGNRTAVGIELEHTLVRAGSLLPVTYGEPGGARWLLEQLAPDYPEATFAEDGRLLGLARTEPMANDTANAYAGTAAGAPVRATVTLEPAGQVELSAGPFIALADALACFQAFEARVDELLAPLGVQALAIGYHPRAVAETLPIIPKARYAAMAAYLGALSPWGPRMMRGTGSTQVSIDYASEADCLRKMRLANLLSPLFALFTDNAPWFEGARSPHAMMRTEIWRHCDPARCGTAPGAADAGFSFERYAEWILGMPAIVALNDDGSVRADARTFDAIFAERPMTEAEAVHALSMAFPDVRLKGFVEIRPADAMPAREAVAYAALVKGLLTNGDSLDALEELLDGCDGRDIEHAKTALMAGGFAANAYGRSARAWADALFGLAARALGEEAALLAPLASRISHAGAGANADATC